MSSGIFLSAGSYYKLLKQEDLPFSTFSPSQWVNWVFFFLIFVLFSLKVVVLSPRKQNHPGILWMRYLLTALLKAVGTMQAARCHAAPRPARWAAVPGSGPFSLALAGGPAVPHSCWTGDTRLEGWAGDRWLCCGSLHDRKAPPTELTFPNQTV